MKNDRKDNIRRERVIMVASSAFVLAALTMTGLYMRGRDEATKDDGYTIDFTQMEQNIADKADEIAGSQDALEDDLDYFPMEAGSGSIEIPGLTMAEPEEKKNAGDNKADNDNKADKDSKAPGVKQDSEKETRNQKSGQDQPASDNGKETTRPADAPTVADASQGIESASGEAEVLMPEQNDLTEAGILTAENPPVHEEAPRPVEETAVSEAVVDIPLYFDEGSRIARPAQDVLIPYSMDGSVYFATLDQYKYNPAEIYQASVDTIVTAGAPGRIVEVYENEEIGCALVLDLGGGYQAIYGQLRDVDARIGHYVNAGDVIGAVASPTKYYSVEGSNLYFQLKKDGVPVDPGRYYEG